MLITTTKGEIEETTLDKRIVETPGRTGTSIATEYYLQGELVRRDVHFKFFDDYKPTVFPSN